MNAPARECIRSDSSTQFSPGAVHGAERRVEAQALRQFQSGVRVVHRHHAEPASRTAAPATAAARLRPARSPAPSPAVLGSRAAVRSQRLRRPFPRGQRQVHFEARGGHRTFRAAAPRRRVRQSRCGSRPARRRHLLRRRSLRSDVFQFPPGCAAPAGWCACMIVFVRAIAPATARRGPTGSGTPAPSVPASRGCTSASPRRSGHAL